LPYSIALLFIGFVILIVQTLGATNRSKLRRIVLHELQTSPNASINEIRTRTGITKGDIQAIIIDLKAERLFNETFSTKTEQIEHLSIQEEPIGSEDIIQYCPNCGSPVAKESDKYCSYCGAEI